MLKIYLGINYKHCYRQIQHCLTLLQRKAAKKKAHNHMGFKARGGKNVVVIGYEL